jgi:hypothetical protein
MLAVFLPNLPSKSLFCEMNAGRLGFQMNSNSHVDINDVRLFSEVFNERLYDERSWVRDGSYRELRLLG